MRPSDVLSVLQDESVREAILTAVRNVTRESFNPWLELWLERPITVEDLSDFISLQRMNGEWILKRAVSEHITPRLHRPLAVTESDIRTAIEAHLLRADLRDIEDAIHLFQRSDNYDYTELEQWIPTAEQENEAYNRFALAVAALGRSIEPASLGAFPLEGSFVECNIEFPHRLFQNDVFQLTICGDVLHAQRGPDVRLFANMEGSCSPCALAAATDEAKSLLSTVFDVLRLVRHFRDRTEGIIQAEEACQGPIFAWNRKPSSSVKLTASLALAKRLIRTYWNSGHPKQFDTALSNAIHLVMQSRREDHPALQVSLLFAGIEALCGEGKDGVVQNLSENVAALLVHEPTARDEFRDQVKRLYGVRCKYVHGESSVDAGNALPRVRLLAAMTLYAATCWLDAETRLREQSVQRKDFLMELRKKRRLGTVDHVPKHLGGLVYLIMQDSHS